ncbi:cytochrome P450 [Herbiconiux sp. L3-i23]|uniref:cytochrome P450 n=1 Tax=Herbiconiux sp. L3-i23 TaxID=2905871 RepID=UPI002062185C|nr:cytochrome P450 [Herbiconiux sp. L3-i23]BDI21840.1 cytochrome P450 [Herbiconiux sp. L3-i23]
MITALRAPDSTLQFLGDGYRFVSKNADRLGVDAFRTRIALRPVLCLRGGEAARFFYEGGRFDRAHAMPPTVVHLLQDRGSVQTLEDGAHAKRKTGFVELLEGSAEARLSGIAQSAFSEALLEWRGAGLIRLRDVLPDLFAGIAMRFAGIPKHRMQREERGPELWAMVENAGSFGVGTVSALARRRRTEKWARELIDDVRAGREAAVEGTPLAAVSEWREADGELLDSRTAAVELLNLLRPTVAVALFAEFAALALIRTPHLLDAFRSGNLALLDGFVHEVRRRTPFFPVIAGRARTDLDWRGDTVPQGTWTMLDLYGTNHDARLWPSPMSFDPTRYSRGAGDARHIVAQGAGDYTADHRCPGEPATEALLQVFVTLLSRVPWSAALDQDLAVRFDRMPAEIRSGVVLRFR